MHARQAAHPLPTKRSHTTSDGRPALCILFFLRQFRRGHLMQLCSDLRLGRRRSKQVGALVRLALVRHMLRLLGITQGNRNAHLGLGPDKSSRRRCSGWSTRLSVVHTDTDTVSHSLSNVVLLRLFHKGTRERRRWSWRDRRRGCMRSGWLR